MLLILATMALCPSLRLTSGGHLRSSRVVMRGPLSDAERSALRLPPKGSSVPSDSDVEWRDDSGDPLGGGDADAEMFAQAQFRVRRRAAAGEYNASATSRSLPLIALIAQVGLGGAISAAPPAKSAVLANSDTLVAFDGVGLPSSAVMERDFVTKAASGWTE